MQATGTVHIQELNTLLSIMVQLIVVGGFDVNDYYMNDIWIYDIWLRASAVSAGSWCVDRRNNSWTEIKPEPQNAYRGLPRPRKFGSLQVYHPGERSAMKLYCVT